MIKEKCDRRILVIGDAMLDRYRFGDVSRISPEAPIPVFKEKRDEHFAPGGAANVAVNLAAIGVATSLCAVVGKDEPGDKLKGLLEELGVDSKLVIKDMDRVTTSKLRYMGPNNQQMLRVDSEDTFELSEGMEIEISNMLEQAIPEYDLVLISDYAKGLLSNDLTQRIIKTANAEEVPVFVDVKGDYPNKYKNATLLKPNRKELVELSRMPAGDIDEAVNAAKTLCRSVNCHYVLATLGADGMILVDKNGLISNIKSVANEIFDVTGAGDTSMAYLAAEYAQGRPIETATTIANIAAGIQVSRVGTSVIEPHEVMKAMRKLDGSDCRRSENREAILSEIDDCRSKGEKIVFTNGCFDILHAGHVSYLKAAKKLGDVLVVGVNDDASVTRLKGNGRPINTIEDRLLVLDSMEAVDYVIPFSEDTPIELIKRVTPDVLVKGGDYKPDEIVGSDYVRSYGGRVEVLPFVEGKSTTDTLNRINSL